MERVLVPMHWAEWAVTKYLEFKGFVLFDIWHPVIIAFRIYLFER